MTTERFELERSSRRILMAGPWVMSILAIFCLLLPFSGDGRSRNADFMQFSALACGLGFGFFAWFFFQITRRFNLANVSLDQDGLWPSAQEKAAALIRWEDVAELRERRLLQRLDVVDASGKVVAALHYQLGDFIRLRSIVLQRAKLGHATSNPDNMYAKPSWYRPLNIAVIAGLGLVGPYLVFENPLVGIGMVLFAGIIAWEYLRQPCQLNLTADTLDMRWPGKIKSYSREAIRSIELGHDNMDGAISHHVTIHFGDGSKKVELKGMRTPAIQLQQILVAWWRGAGSQ